MTGGPGIDAGLRRKLDEAWKLLAANGQTSSVQVLRERLEGDAQAVPTVVVIGEAKRGKSSLINALVGAHVAPIGVDIVTGAYVAYVPATVDHPIAPGRASVAFTDGTSEIIAIEDLADWVTVSANRGGEDRGVVSATARLAEPGALDVILVDTPGVGSLIAGHGDIALRAAREAAALIFVTDAGQDFTAPEKSFLESAAADIDTVVFAVTKIDKHPVTWQESVARDRALLAEHAPRFADADFVGVSSTLAAEAASAPDADVRDVLRDESRIPELVAVLTKRVAARAETLATANALRGTVTALRAGMSSLDERVAAIRSSESAVAAATAEREELKELEKRSKRWGRDFEAAANRLRRALVEQLSQQTSDLEHQWRARISALPPAQLRDEDAQRNELAALAGEVAGASSAVLESFSRSLAAEAEALLSKDLARAQELAAQLGRLGEVTPEATTGSELPPAPRPPFTEYLLRSGFMGFGMANLAGMAVSIVSGGSAAGGAMVGGLAALGPLAVPAVVAFGLSMAFRTQRTADAERVRSQLREHGAKTVQRMQQNVMLRADGLVGELRPLLAESMESFIEQRAAQLQEILAEAKKAARAAPAERQRQVQPLQKMRNTFSIAVSDLDTTIKRMSSGTSVAPSASKDMTATVNPGSPW